MVHLRTERVALVLDTIELAERYVLAVISNDRQSMVQVCCPIGKRGLRLAPHGPNGGVPTASTKRRRRDAAGAGDGLSIAPQDPCLPPHLSRILNVSIAKGAGHFVLRGLASNLVL
jgi:hypothetical protein